jgi:hypothetical protein
LDALEPIAQRDKAAWLKERQRPQKHAFNDGEDGGGRANAESERDYRGQSEPRRPLQLTQRKASVPD